MSANRLCFLLVGVCSFLAATSLAAAVSAQPLTMPAEQLRDKIRGGLLGQILGNLNGLPHEMKYIAAPGQVKAYTPALPQGAKTDDDTDFEWVYIKVMEDENCLLLPPGRIARLWRERINQRIWCSNQFARQLMDLGIEPPLTGLPLLNPWAEFNISGQFLSETFGLIAPALPRRAAEIGLNYTRVAIGGEPAQTTQFFTTMIALAFVETDIGTLLDHGVAALDPESVIRQVVRDVRTWHREQPEDWPATRRRLQEKYQRYRGGERDRNGFELNTGAVVGALLYGGGDFARTLLLAFNFGWDADCNAATAGTIVGVMKGYRWMLAQGWTIVDRYKNTTRDHMPGDETITSFADRLVDLAERVILEQGGRRETVKGRIVYQLVRQEPGCVQRLENVAAQAAALKAQLGPAIRRTIARGGSPEELARAAYLAICLDLAPELRAADAAAWDRAIEALEGFPKVVQVVFHHSPVPLGEPLRAKAVAAGLRRPPSRQKLW